MSKISASDGSSDLQLSSTERLFSIWSARYLSQSCKTVSSHALESAASLQGRQRTVERLRSDLVKDSCKRAALRTKDLYAHHKNLDLKEAAELARFANVVYPVLLDFYRTHEPVSVSSQLKDQSVGRSSLRVFAIPEIHTLASLIEPLLSEFQSDDVRSTNWQTRSFLTTALNLSGKLLL